MHYRRAGAALVVALLAAVGCQTPTATVPKTYPVKGKVVYKGSNKPVAGRIDFRPKDGTYNASATLGSHGDFVLRTLAGNQNLEGAAEGTYEVTVAINSDPRDPQIVSSVAVPGTFQVKGDGPNDFTITIDRPK